MENIFFTPEIKLFTVETICFLLENILFQIENILKTIKNEHIKVISKWYHLPYGATAIKCTNTINISTCSPCILSIMYINIGGIFTFLVHLANRKYPACVPLSHHFQFSIDPHNFLTKIPSQQLENDFDNFLIL